jgi:hypothetical protein
MRGANAVGRLLPRIAAPSASAWWKRARSDEPLAGAPAAAAVDALDALAGSLRDDAALHLIGRFAARDDTLRMARTHLRIERTLRDDPAIADTQLPAPIFILGWPRTGTTFLHRLLACDPAHRALPYWESFDPVPPREGPDRRPQKLDRMLRQLALFAPDYHAIHPMTAHGVEECVALFMNVFRTLQFDIQYRVPSYVDWLLRQDARVAYAAYRRQLQLVQHHRPHGERFLLKDPTHLVHLEALVELFPDARLVFTHRDPPRALSSLCSLYAHTRAIFSDEVDAHAIGREILGGYWPRALARALELRERLPKGRVADVRHGDLTRDPIGAVERLYRELGLGFDEPQRRPMQEFLATRAPATVNAHEHSPEGFGLAADAIRERFADYSARFALSEASSARSRPA